MILPFLLHHANRCAKNYPYLKEFYAVKDRLLKSAVKDGYDIQHIRGLRCRSCGGTGVHEKYSMYPPYKVYDTDGCWRCGATGFYKLPIWICLQRVKFGRYLFHQPLKRELCVRNPWTEKNMGWCVSDRPVVEGYIEHQSTWFGIWALLILFLIYDYPTHKKLRHERLHIWRWRVIWKVRKLKKFLTWDGIVMEKPLPFIKHFQYADGYRPIDPNLPF